jgi:hypothetical protein
MEINNKNAAMRKNKKAFAFTFLAFFLSTIIFSVAFLTIYEGDYEKDNVFKDSRITFVNEEIVYFKKTYLPNAVSFSLYNTLDSLMDYTKDPINYNKINQNYSKFNDLVLEGMLNGSFDNDPQAHLLSSPNKTITYFLQTYKEKFKENYMGNFTFDIINMNVYEEKPYYVNVKILANLSIQTLDNISSWQTQELIDISVPIYDLRDPLFFRYANTNISLVTSEFNFPNQEWDLETFNQTLLNTYSTVYYDERHKYTIGSSFLNRFLNYTTHSYEGVVGLWSFDYDLEKNEVYDSAGFSNNSKFYGNTRVSMTFNNATINGNNIPDFTGYENNATINDNPDCNVRGIDNTACNFDGINDYLLIDNANQLNMSGPLSFSIWIKPDDIIPSDSYATIIRMTQGAYGTTNDGFAFRYQDSSSQIEFIIGNTSDYDAVISENITSTNTWTNFIGVYNTTHLKLYQNGILVDKKETDISQIKYLTDELYIASWDGANYFKGSIDEFNLYSKPLSEAEIGNIYKQRKVVHVDYVNSYHKKGIELDGIDDYVLLNFPSKFDDLTNDDFSIEFWFKPYKDKFNLLIFQGETTIGYQNEEICFRDNKGNPLDCSFANLTMNNWHHLVIIRDNVTQTNHYYVDGKNLSTIDSSDWDPDLDGGVFTLGAGPVPGLVGGAVTGTFFKGILDEVKIYNRTLTKEEIQINYNNYDSYSKGCCNYLMLVDPHKFGYNNPSYKENVSYSSTQFFNYHNRGIKPDILLWNISAITSQDTTKKYYNFLADQCVVQAYNILDFQNDSIHVEPYYKNGTDEGSCYNLIKMGVY